MDLLDRFRGCLLGVAVGDALGMPTEGYTAREIKTKFGMIREMMPAPEGHFHTGLSAGQFTDDTEETLILAESIIEAGGYSPDRFAEKLIAWGTTWTLDERLNRGVGFATRSAVESMIAGTAWQQSGLAIPTCGAAMRAAPMGLLYHTDLNIVKSYADLQSLPTHASAAARAAAVAVAVGVALSLTGFSKEMVLRNAVSQASRLDAEFAERLLWVGALLDLQPEDALGLIRNSPLAAESVPAAFYCFLKFEPEEALVMAASCGGDTDSIASIAGSLFGASYGPSWIPESWLAALEGKMRIEDAARGLFELSATFCR
ncbi:MAG: ADP-ribosylglycohydrolase family protein [Methanothrix sp.]|jgi:ADP-ribosylglycohydrolase|nr:ADP-ribosylglycohydrolase family protein [Methanothrix sp.]